MLTKDCEHPLAEQNHYQYHCEYSAVIMSDFYDSSTFANTFQEMQQSQLLSGGHFWTRHNWGYVQRNSRLKKRRELL